MSRAKDKYRLIKKERFLCSYIVRGKDGYIRVGYVGDLEPIVREINTSVGIEAVHVFKGTTQADLDQLAEHLKPFQKQTYYTASDEHAKILMMMINPKAEYLLNPILGIERPKSWKLLSSWVEGERVEGLLNILPTNEKHHQRYVLKLQDGSSIGIYTNNQLEAGLRSFKDGSKVSIVCVQPFIDYGDDSSNQPSQFNVESMTKPTVRLRRNKNIQS